MRVIEKIEVSKLKYGCVVVTQNFLFNYSLFKIILNPSKKVEFSSENQKDVSVDGNYYKGHSHPSAHACLMNGYTPSCGTKSQTSFS